MPAPLRLQNYHGNFRLCTALTLLAVFCSIQGCSQSQPEIPPNILVVIGDDMGIETLSSFGLGVDTAKTATLDELAAHGVRFNNFWAQPVCSPTRATILTGRYGFRTGVGGPIGNNEERGEMPEPRPVPAGVLEVAPRPEDGGRISLPAGGR